MIIQNLFDLFKYHTLNIEYFRIIFSLVVLAKFITETKRGYYNYLNDGEYLQVLQEVKQGSKILKEFPYKIIYVLKFFGVFGLLTGWFPYISALILIASFLVEKEMFFKFHTNFFILLLLGLLVQRNLGEMRLATGTSKSASEYLILLTLATMYFGTGLKKINPAFLSGQVIYYTFRGLEMQKHLRKHRDLIFIRLLDYLPVRKSYFWSALAAGTIVTEIYLSIFIWQKDNYCQIIALAMVMHLSFLLISFRTLFHFSFACLSCYLLIVPQSIMNLIHDFFLNILSILVR